MACVGNRWFRRALARGVVAFGRGRAREGLGGPQDGNTKMSAMPEPALLIWIRRVEVLEASQRRLRLGVVTLSCLAIVLTAAVGGRTGDISGSSISGLAQASSPRGREAVPADVRDPLYDEFLMEFKRLRGDAARRRYLADQVLAASAEHRVDPDLLFALIAAESRFDSKAVSPKGARGLGQLMFRTARSVAPQEVRRPEDLHSVPRNLSATAGHLRQLMDEGSGDVRKALRAYHRGGEVRSAQGRESDKYVARVSTYYASLKAQRIYRQLPPVAVAETGSAKN